MSPGLSMLASVTAVHSDHLVLSLPHGTSAVVDASEAAPPGLLSSTGQVRLMNGGEQKGEDVGGEGKRVSDEPCGSVPVRQMCLTQSRTCDGSQMSVQANALQPDMLRLLNSMQSPNSCLSVPTAMMLPSPSSLPPPPPPPRPTGCLAASSPPSLLCGAAAPCRAALRRGGRQGG